MNDEHFSIIVTTRRGIESLKPLFVTTDEKSELIIIDDDYNETTKKWLESQSGYEKIVYAPIKQSSQKHQRTFSQGLNTALMYAENRWLIRADDNLEFREDFFQCIRETLEDFKETLGTDKFIVIGQKLWGSLNHQKWQDYSGHRRSRYSQVKSPSFTFSFGIFPITCCYALNGYDERYDCGWGKEDTQFLHRALVFGYQVFFDKEMMAYSLAHEPKRFSIPITEILYMLDFEEINNGKIRAFNPFNLQESQREFLARKKDFVIDA